MSVLQPEDTIAAVATAPGSGAISIIRLSGPDSLMIADRLVPPPALRPSSYSPNSFFRANIVDPGHPDQVLDQAIILIFRAPHSYTGDDLVEFQIHGGPIQSRRLLHVLIESGARPADPGEFTQRAFLNGKLDLVQAEGVADLIQSHSERASILAVEQINGSISSYIKTLYENMMTVSSYVENSLDFSAEDFPKEIFPKSETLINRALTLIDELLNSWNQGRVIREGALVVITGPPNVGKSTLLNKLLGFDRAIVTDIPGTTRDTIEEGLLLDGFQIRLADTAGIRDTDCKIEKIGIDRARSLLEKADVIINMIDASNITLETELALKSALIHDETIVFANKIDLASNQDLALLSCYSQKIIRGSLINAVGIDELKNAILSPIKSKVAAIHSFSISERHYSILSKAREEILRSSALLKQIHTEDLVLVSNHLRSALELLGTINGQVYTEQLLENIFSRFCVGK
jgi:tRNA modification GTPase